MGGTGSLVKALGKLIEEVGIKVSLNKTIVNINLKENRILNIVDHYGNQPKC